MGQKSRRNFILVTVIVAGAILLAVSLVILVHTQKPEEVPVVEKNTVSPHIGSSSLKSVVSQPDKSPVESALAPTVSEKNTPTVKTDLIEELKKALAKTNSTEGKPHELLKKIVANGNKYVDELTELLEKGNAEEKEYSAAALAMIGTSQSVGPLIQAVKNCEDPRLRDNLRGSFDLISKSEAAPVLLECLGERANRDVVETAKEVLARNANPAILQSLTSRIDEESNKESPQRLIISDGVQTFMKINRKELFVPLSTILEEEHSTATILGAGMALANISSTEAAKALVDATSTSQGDKKEVLLNVISNIKPQGTADFVVYRDTLISQSDKDLRIAAARAVSKYSPQLALPVLKKAVENETSEEVRKAIRIEIGKISGSPQNDKSISEE